MEGEKTHPETSGADDRAASRPEPTGTSGAGPSAQAANQLDDEELEFDSFFSTRKPKDFKAGVSSGMKSIGVHSLCSTHSYIWVPYSASVPAVRQ